MPNGGTHHCKRCYHFKNGTCILRNEQIGIPYWTTCQNWNTTTFKENKWKIWENLTSRNMNKPVAFIVDDKVYSTPMIKDKIPHGKISLTGGGLSKTEVRKLVAIISSGPVPLKFTIVSKN
jgi:preprotein translocase subunit SecD